MSTIIFNFLHRGLLIEMSLRNYSTMNASFVITYMTFLDVISYSSRNHNTINRFGESRLLQSRFGEIGENKNPRRRTPGGKPLADNPEDR